MAPPFMVQGKFLIMKRVLNILKHLKQPDLCKWLINNHLSVIIISFFFTFFMLTITIGFAQIVEREPYFDRIMSENVKIERGISQNSIVSIVQDNKGFMWFGTLDGLNRFDGYKFTIYNKEQGLTNESIRCMLVSNDTLWVGTEHGLNRIILSYDKIDCFYKHIKESNSLVDNWINSIFKDHRGQLWICTSNGLDLFEYSKNNFRHFTDIETKYGLPGLQYNKVLQDEKHNYYIATDRGLFIMDAVSGEVEIFTNDPSNRFSLPDNHINTLMFGKNQQLYVGTNKGLAIFNKTSKTFEKLISGVSNKKALETDQIICLIKDLDIGIWVGTYGNGLYFINTETNEIKAYHSKLAQNYSLSNNRVLSIYQGDDGIVWIGTFNGLNKLDRDAPKFRAYRANYEFLSGFSSNQVWSFLEYSPHEILVGTDNGISVYDRKSRLYSQSELFNGPSVGLKNKQIRCLFRDSRNNYWIGTRHDGLYRFDPVSGKRWNYKYNPIDKNSISNNFILDIIEDRKGCIWIATGNGLNRIDESRKEFDHFFYNDSDFNSLADNKLYDLYLNRRDQLWITTANGLAMFNEIAEDFTTYKIPKLNSEVKISSTNSFYSVLEDEEGIMWLGSRGGGLIRFDIKKNEFSVLTMKDGLPDNIVYMVLEDRFKDIWLTTNWGLTRYNKTSRSISNFDITDGLQCNEFNWNAGYIASDGEIFVGGMNGFNAFYPEEISTHKGKQNIRITGFKKFNILQNQVLNDGDTLWLEHDDNFFSFEFSALDYTNPSKSTYRYMLENYDTKWIEKNAGNRIAEYTRVSPGTYYFRLMSTNTGGQWPESGINFTIIVRQPWYSTWYFRAIVVFALGIIIYSLILFRMRLMKRKHESVKQIYAIEKKLYQLEQKALQLQMNPHFLFNSLNSIQGLILGSDIDAAVHYLSKFSQLMRMTLSNSTESFIPLVNELNALMLYVELETFRFGERFDFSIKIDPKIDQEFTEIPPMILQPYVENAIIHGILNRTTKGKLFIELVLEGQNLVCVIQDDGVGRKKAIELREQSGIERASKGMSITSERLAILNHFSNDIYSVKIIDLFDEQGNPSGTRVEVNIYLRK